VTGSPSATLHRNLIITLAARHKLPAVYYPAHTSVRRSACNRTAIASRSAYPAGSGRAETSCCRRIVGPITIELFRKCAEETKSHRHTDGSLRLQRCSVLLRRCGTSGC
jgi:hypothetical protein